MYTTMKVSSIHAYFRFSYSYQKASELTKIHCIAHRELANNGIAENR